MRRILTLSVALGSILAAVDTARAVIVYDTTSGATGRNTSEPPVGSAARQGWFLQGQWGNYLGTPIGPNHFISALHAPVQASANPFSFRGIDYSIDTSFGGGGFMDVPGSDLRIWKVNGTFPEHAQLYNPTDESTKPVTVFGRGTSRGGEILASGGTPTQLRGWYWGPHDSNGASVMSWGENNVLDTINDPVVGSLLRFTFNRTASPVNEAHLSDGDSGGGVFIADNGVWELAGINYAVEGPFSLSSDGSNPFSGAIFDKGRLYHQVSGEWQQIQELPTDQSTVFFSSRISTRAAYIYSVIQNASIVQQQNWNVLDHYVVANVSVGNILGVGDTSQPSKTTSLTANHIRSATLNIRNNASVSIRPNGGPAGVSRLTGQTGLVMSGNATMDVTDNSLIVQTGDLATISNLVRTGRNNGAWNGTGIISSTARDNPNHGLAVIRNTDDGSTPLLADFQGQTGLNAAAILVAYTLNGDTDLDFAITKDDYARIDRGYLLQNSDPGTYRTYRWGDFNLDGAINLADYDLIDDAFQFQNPGASVPVSAVRPVPEPGVMSMIAGAALLGLRRRRR